MQAFTDLVGAAVVPAHCFDSTELTDLTPALDPANTCPAHDTCPVATSLTYTCWNCSPTGNCLIFGDVIPVHTAGCWRRSR